MTFSVSRTASRQFGQEIHTFKQKRFFLPYTTVGRTATLTFSHLHSCNQKNPSQLITSSRHFSTYKNNNNHNQADYLKIVEDILKKEWNHDKYPIRMKKEDWDTGIKLLTKIAVDAIKKEPSLKEAESIKTNQITPLNGIVHEIFFKKFPFSFLDDSSSEINKIKAFVEDNSHEIRNIFKTNFPFSHLDSSSNEIALKTLKYILEHSNLHHSILSHFLMSIDEWMSEEELNTRFSNPFQQLQFNETELACSFLKRTYLKNKDNKAGYYLLWLIKQITGSNYEIPKKSSFNETSVAEVLSKFIINSGTLTNAANFIEILNSRYGLDRSLYREFLDPEACSIFLNFTVEQLKEIPIDKWPNKISLIIDLLEAVTFENKLIIGKALASSEDPITSEVGNHLLAALKACSLKEAVPNFNALTKISPYFDFAQTVFSRPFVPLCHGPFLNPPFLKELRFNDVKEVFVFGSIIIGVYNSYKEGVLPHLLAYKIKTEELVWEIPLTPILLDDSSLNINATPKMDIPRMGPEEYTLKSVGKLLSLQFTGKKKLYFINPETGEIDSTLKLPEAFKNEGNRLHISEKGFAYQMIREGLDSILIGGEIINQSWKSSFEPKNLGIVGLFRPLSTHCGFQQESSLILLGPIGDQVIIKDCMAAEAQEDRLYSIEKDSIYPNICRLTTRTLKTDNNVASSVEKSILINVKAASFGKICPNGQVVLFSGNHSETSPIFVDLNTGKITYSQHKFSLYHYKSPSCAKYIITNTGELLTRDERSEKIWKVSQNKIECIGSMKSDEATHLAHIDDDGNIYFTH